ncbi:MAG: class I SAM-dependent methyltransferase [Chloroflexota bacterium]
MTNRLIRAAESIKDSLMLTRHKPSDWQETGHFRTRSYQRYSDYVWHQRHKVRHIDLGDYDRQYSLALSERLTVPPGCSVLCLAARLGTEVKAFFRCGCFAVGIDLEPGSHNRYVLQGDFHQLVFPDACVDVVFTNSLDHALQLERLLEEVKRVSKPDGTFIVEAMHGNQSGFGPYEVVAWPSLDALVERISASGLTNVRRTPFDYPWAGEQLVFRFRHDDVSQAASGQA